MGGRQRGRDPRKAWNGLKGLDWTAFSFRDILSKTGSEGGRGWDARWPQLWHKGDHHVACRGGLGTTKLVLEELGEARMHVCVAAAWPRASVRLVARHAVAFEVGVVLFREALCVSKACKPGAGESSAF